MADAKTQTVEDPVKQEIDRLKARLADGMAELRAETNASLDESEKLARQARGSRSSMRAVTSSSAVRTIAPRERLATPPPGELTNKFRALR
jgi:hypothetical protein